MLLPFQGIQHFLHQIVNIQKFQLHGRIADGDGQVVGIVVAESGHGTVVVGTAPLAEQIGEPVNQHLCSGFSAVGEEQFLPFLFAQAIAPVGVTADQGGLDGRRQHHRAGVAIALQGIQQGRGKAKVAFMEILRVFRPVYPRQVEDKIRLTAALLQHFRSRLQII